MPPDAVISRWKKFHIVAAEHVVESVNVGTAVFADPTTPGCWVHADPDIYRYYSDTSLSKVKHNSLFMFRWGTFWAGVPCSITHQLLVFTIMTLS